MSIIEVDDFYDETGELYKWTTEPPKTTGFYWLRKKRKTYDYWYQPEVIVVCTASSFEHLLNDSWIEVQWSDRPIKLPKLIVDKNEQDNTVVDTENKPGVVCERS